MGKVEINKQNKRSSLLQTSYDLFLNQGFAKTTIADIAKKAGLAKGTFYLYFKDKYDLRDELVARKSAQLLLEAQEAMKLRPEPLTNFEDYLLALTDYILNYLQRNKLLLKFISKNLSWGIFKHALEKAEESGAPESEPFTVFYKDYLDALQRSGIRCAEPELLLFTIIELISSTGYSCILYESPTDLAHYLPYLHRSIHQVLEGFKEG